MASTDLLVRYLYAVGEHLPAQRRQDILSELGENLRTEIEDKAAELGRPLTEEEQAEVLRQHGHPLLVAARYRQHRALIGPEIFPYYVFTAKRLLPLVLGVYLLAQAASVLFPAAGAPMAQRIEVGHIVTGALGAIFQFLAVLTAAFAAVEYFKAHFRQELLHPAWDPRRLPRVFDGAVPAGPRHPIADTVTSAAFLAWLLLFPHVPLLMFGPYISRHLVNLDLPLVWHQFYWLIVGFNLVQLLSKIALLSPGLRRYFHFIDASIHLLGLAILVFLLRAHDYIGASTFGGTPLAAATVTNINSSIHRGLILVLVISTISLVWDLLRWPRRIAAEATDAGLR